MIATWRIQAFRAALPNHIARKMTDGDIAHVLTQVDLARGPERTWCVFDSNEERGPDTNQMVITAHSADAAILEFAKHWGFVVEEV